LIQTTAQSWLLFQFTNSPFYLGLEGLCLGLPRVLFSALGGAIVDRADRKIIFVVTQIAFLLMTLSRCNELFGDDPSLVPVDRLSTHRLFCFAMSRSFPLSLTFLFIAGGFQTTFLSAIATLLQIHSDESNRGRMMSLFGLINRGLGPMGSFPFGLIATAIGASATVAVCGMLTVAVVGYVVVFQSHLGDAKPIGES